MAVRRQSGCRIAGDSHSARCLSNISVKNASVSVLRVDVAPYHSVRELIFGGEGHVSPGDSHVGLKSIAPLLPIPPATHESGLCTGAAHSSDYSMWRKNEYVSNGLRDFAERGEAWALMKEIEAAGEKLQSVHAVFSAPAVPSGTGQTSAELEVHPRHSLVSRG